MNAVTIRRRPFAVWPATGTMLPDGIFDTSIGTQVLTCYVTNESANDLDGVTVYLESIGDPGVAITAYTHQIGRLRAGASLPVFWTLDLSAAIPGKKLVSVVVNAAGIGPTRIIQRIFVTRTTYDDNTGTWRCETPQGTLEVTGLTAIPPGRDGWDMPDPRNPERCAPTTGPYLPARINMRVIPNPAYSGDHGELPFADPWWKIVGWIVFAIACIVGIIAAAAGAGTFNVSVKGKFEETDPSVKCCTPAPKTEFTVAGIAGAVASVAFVVGCADDADPYRRGQEATPPPNGTLTVAETAHVELRYPAGPPQAGTAYQVAVDWTYTRELDDGQALEHHVSETRRNTHLAEGVNVKAPDHVTRHDEKLCVTAVILRPGGKPYHGDELYVIAIFESPAGLSFVELMNDGGTGPDTDPDDGTYTACLDLNHIFAIHHRLGKNPDGFWKIFVFAQDVNGATPDQLPEVAAQQVGGYPVAAPVELTFDPSLPCPLKAQATVLVTET